jgi:hypothetical protein
MTIEREAQLSLSIRSTGIYTNVVPSSPEGEGWDERNVTG